MPRKNKIAIPTIKYVAVDEELHAKTLDDVFSFIFEKALEKERIDNLVSFSYIDNDLRRIHGQKSGTRVLNRSTSGC